jgi:hypothetical protein
VVSGSAARPAEAAGQADPAGTAFWSMQASLNNGAGLRAVQHHHAAAVQTAASPASL